MSKEISKEISKEQTNTLLNCPFCGGEARTASVFGRAGVICTECDANIRMFLDAPMEEAIKAWNTRKPMQNIVERLEEKNGYLPKELIHCHEFYIQGMLNGLIEAIEIVKEEGGV